MSDRKQIAFDDSITKQFMETDGKRHKDKMVHLLAVDKKREAMMMIVDKKIENLQDSVNEIKRMLEGAMK